MIFSRSRPIVLAFATLLAASGCSKQAKERRILARAKQDFDAEHYDKAEIEYRNALALVPMDPPAVRQLGFIYFNEGRVMQAYSALKKASTQAPDDAEVWLRLAECETDLGMRQEAPNAARRALAGRPGDEQALLVLAAAARGNPDAIAAARDEIGKWRESDRDRAGYHVALGMLALEARAPDAAEAEFRRALALDPKSASAHAELGNIAWLRKDLPAAEAEFKQAAALAPARSVLRLRLVDFKLSSGALDEARRLLEEVARSAPDYLPFEVYQMKLAYDQKRFEDCSALVAEILARDGLDYDALLERGKLKLLKGDLAGAIGDLERLNHNYDRSPEAKYTLALAYLRNGDAARGDSLLDQAIGLAPNYVPAVLMRADVRMRLLGDPAAAIGLLQPLLAQQPKNVRAALTLARAYEATNQMGPAAALYRRLAELFPGDPEPAYLSGMNLVKQNRVAEARQAFEKALALSPDYAPAVEMLVNLDLVAKRYAAASERVQAAMQKYPKSAAPLLLMAKVDGTQRNLAAAESDLRKALELDPNAQNASLLLARVYVAEGKQEQALAGLQSLADKTGSATARLQVGILQAELNRYDDAKASLEKVLATNPKSVPALDDLAFLYAEHFGQVPKAEELAKQAREIAPDDPLTADTLGWVEYRKGEYHSALALLQEGVAKAPANADIQYHLGMAHYMLGEEDAARAALRQAVAAPPFPDQAEARKRLAVLEIDPAKAGPAEEAALTERARVQPEDLAALTRLAQIQERRGEAKEAAASFEAAAKLDSRNAGAMLELAQLYAGPLKDAARAREWAKEAHALAPDNVHTTQILGRLLYRTGDYRWSLTLLEDAARQLPDDPEANFDLARADMSVGKTSQAEELLQPLLQGPDFPHRGEAARMSAMLAAAHSPEEAQAALPQAERILERQPDYVPALMVAGLARQQQGDFTGAGKRYDQALAADPLFAPAARQLAVLCAEKLGNDPKALDLATEARKTYPSDPDLAKVLGAVNYRKGDYGSAARFLREAAAGRPDDAEALYWLGMSLFQLKQTATSRMELQRALALKLPDADAEEASRVLAEMKDGASAQSPSAQPIN